MQKELLKLLGSSMNTVAFRHGLVDNLADCFKARDLADSTNMALVIREGLGDKCFDEI
jgi:hypothetical protein